MIGNSIKQIFRMKIQPLCFFLFMVITGTFLALSSNLLIQNTKNVKDFEQQFTTIGTVEQEASSIAQTMEWDAQKKDYIIRRFSEYKELYTPDDLLFEGAEYIKKPEKRSYYGSYGPEYILSKDGGRSLSLSALIVEFSPVEDCVPNESVKINIKSVLSGQQMNQVWFCDHSEKDPETLYKDKTYIAYLLYWHSRVHGSHVQEGNQEIEYIPVEPVASQYDEAGNLMKEEPLKSYYEVTEGFYESEIGKRYLNLANSGEQLKDTFPVTGTNSTNLLMAFYSGEAYIKDGVDISEKEYEDGSKVCLVSEKFADRNQLKVGDYVTARLYYTNAQAAASHNFSEHGSGFDYILLKAGGTVPEIFEKARYRIKGIYSVTPSGESGEFAMASNEMIVPMNSIKKTNECNIIAYGPMKANTTSFQIPNGRIDEFMKNWEKQGNDDLTITFYDKGYTQLKKGLDNMKLISLVLGIVAVIMGIAFLLFYIHLFLGSQKKRMAIERCIGFSKRRCITSIASGILLIFLTGTIIGGIGGTILSRKISVDTVQKEYYDTMYSSGKAREMKGSSIEKVDLSETVSISLIFVGGYVLLGCALLIKNIKDELDKEPLQLLYEVTKE